MSDLDPKIEKVLAGMLVAPGPPSHEIPIEQARINHRMETEALCGEGPPVADVRDLTVPGPGGEIPVRVCRPEGDGPLPLVVFLHGGGWALGSIDTYDALARALADASGAIVASVEYRLAPESHFPAAVDDCLAAVRWAAATGAELGADPSRLAIAGDSAGGNLAAVCARRLRGELDLRLQVLIYPAADGGVNTPSFREFGERFGLTAAGMRRFWELYLDGADSSDPDASPMRDGDLSGLPPAYVLTADHDVLRDEGEAYAHAMRDAGVEVELVRWPGTIHGFVRWLAATDIAGEAIGAIGARLRAALAQ
jgi:acetyl esterase